MPLAVQLLWAALLLLVLLLLPFVVVALHQAWRASRNVDRYFAEMLTAAAGIAGHTAEIRQLDATIETAGAMLATAGGIHEKAQTLGATLAERAGRREER